jgi:hypothetical protein
MPQSLIGIFAWRTSTWREDYALMPVVATVKDELLTVATDPVAQFPREGKVYIHGHFDLPPPFEAHLWQANWNPTHPAINENPHFAEYSVEKADNRIPLEIIEIGVDSNKPDKLRKILRERIDVRYPLRSKFYVQTSDGLVLGPLEAIQATEISPTSARCRDDQFKNQISAWEDIASLKPFSVTYSGGCRIFSGMLRPPEPDKLYDLATPKEIILSVLHFVSKEKPGKSLITKKELSDLAEHLSRDIPQKLQERLSYVLAVLKTSTGINDNLDAAMELLMHNETVLAELEAYKLRLDGEVRKNAETKLTSLKSEMENVKVREEEARSALKSLRRQANTEEKRIEKTARKVAEKAKSQLAQVQADPSDLAAAALIISRFSGLGSDKQLHINEMQEVGPSEAIKSVNDLRSALATNYRSLSITGFCCTILADEVCATLLGGQMVTFSGSLASSLSTATALAIDGEGTRQISIPIGVLDSVGFNDLISEVWDLSDNSKNVRALLLRGISHSPIEVYGEHLHYLLEKRAMSGTDIVSGPVIIATIDDSPSSLPVSNTLIEFGPVINTDALIIGKKIQPTDRYRGAILRNLWTSYPRDTSTFYDDADLYKRLKFEICNESTILMQRQMDTAYKLLKTLPCNGNADQAIVSTSFGWIVPAALFSGKERENLRTILIDSGIFSQPLDPRLVKLVSGGQSPE